MACPLYIIDIQITAASIEPRLKFIDALTPIGYLCLEHLTIDHAAPGMDESPHLWQKIFFRTDGEPRRANIHVRVDGNPNERYALLFRDYLRAHPHAAGGYAEVKRQLARYHPDDLDAYYDVKDPVCDIIMAGAEEWASVTHWSPGTPDA